MSVAASSAAVRPRTVRGSWSSTTGSGPCPSGRRMVLTGEASHASRLPLAREARKTPFSSGSSGEDPYGVRGAQLRRERREGR